MDVDAYINDFHGEAKARLLALRQLIKAEVPDAIESFSYGLVGYKLNDKPLVYFGGFTHHTGFYATPNGHEAFAEEFSKYKQGKGSVQFSLDQPLPIELIKRVLHYRKTQVKGGHMATRLDASNDNVAIGLALGLILGAVASFILNNWGLIGVGLCVGVGLGLTVDFTGKKKK